jgi:hypothetical protein
MFVGWLILENDVLRRGLIIKCMFVCSCVGGLSVVWITLEWIKHVRLWKKNCFFECVKAKIGLMCWVVFKCGSRTTGRQNVC